MGLGTDLTLLAIDADASGRPGGGPALDYALTVAELVELAAAGRIAVRGGAIAVLDRTPIGDGPADDSLARLADPGQPGQSVAQWVERRGRWRFEAYLAGLRYDHVLREPSTARPDRIEIADTLRAQAPVRRLRVLMDDAAGPPSVTDLAFVALARYTGWPQAHLRIAAHGRHRARIERLAAAVAGSGEVPGFSDDPVLPVLRQGLRAVARLGRAAEADRVRAAETAAASSSRADNHGAFRNSRTLLVIVYAVGLLATATLVLAGLTNLDLTIILAPFMLVLIALPCVDLVQRGRRRWRG
jgi:Golgi phosphoprotein 3 (GPP34)